jgi:hypothetical protein
MKARIMKMVMIQKPRAIQDVPGFMPARTALVGDPRSRRRKALPIIRAGKEIHNPTVVVNPRPSPMKPLIAAMV